MIKINPMLIPGLKRKKSIGVPVNRDEVIKAVAKEFGVKPEEVFRKCRKREIVMSRQVSMFMIKQLEPLVSLKTLGYYFGGKDHTTVIHSLKTVRDLMDTDDVLRYKVERIKTLLLYPV